MHRAWPALAGGAAPMFDTLVQDGVKVLITNRLPITCLYRLLTDTVFRNQLLAVEDDADIVSFFHDQFDRLSLRDQADQAGAALRRAHLLTFSPVLKYSLGQTVNRLDFRTVMDENRSMIINLALADAEARRLFGCLLTVTAEQAAFSRAELPPNVRHRSHVLIMDEFAEFSAKTEESLARILSLCRKYGLFLVMAHQTWSQTSERLRGALQNAGIEVTFKLGRTDAEHSAAILGRVNPMAVKHEVADAGASGRTHPVFYSPSEQWEAWVQAITDLRPRHAFLRLPHGTVTRVGTVSVPDPPVDPQQLRETEAEYLSRYFRPQAEIEQELTRYRRATTAVRRVERLGD